jgi:hypothetical protein
MKLLHITLGSIVALLAHTAAGFAQGFDRDETEEATATVPSTESSNLGSQPGVLIKHRAFAVTAELTASTLGVGAEASVDLGYLGIAAGAATTLLESQRTYVMARAQTPGIVAAYIGVGGASVSDHHTDLNLFSNLPDQSYTEESSNMMAEMGAKLQLGYLSARLYVGLDSELETNCRESQGDCDHMPMYAGLAFGVALH